VAEHLRPGLTEEEFEHFEGMTALRLPAELRVWWGWHNGTSIPCPIGPGWWLYLPLHDALARYTYHRNVLERVQGGHHLGLEWRWSYFPFTHRYAGPNDALFVDIDQDPDEPSPVWYFEPMKEWFDAPRVPSLTAAVQLWVDLLESDAWHWNAEEDGWDVVDERVPYDVRMTAIT
jgi:hypothetical protein